MMWNHGMDWHWLGSLAIVLFWALIILLALAPINYLRAELDSQERDLQGKNPDAPDAATAASNPG